MTSAPFFAFYALRVCATGSMIAFDVWCVAALWRVMRNRGRFYDPMRAVVAWPTTNTLWYQLRGWVYGLHLEAWMPSEFVVYALAAICTIVGAHLVFKTIRMYEYSHGATRS